MAKKKDQASEPQTATAQLMKDLATLPKGVLSVVKTADQMTDMTVECISTGFPQLDAAMREQGGGGLPRGRDVEFYSRTGQSGKTSVALQIVAAAQRQGFRTAWVDGEHKFTEDYANSLGVVTQPDQNPDVAPMLLVRGNGQLLTAEEILDAIRGLSKIVDLIVVDSIAALEKEDNIAKTAGEDNGMGGISKLLNETLRANLRKRACVVWINQSRMEIGGFNPSGGKKYSTPGGMAVGFFTTMRVELAAIEKIKSPGSDEPIGMKVQFFVTKNQIAPPFRKATLSYIFGDGFSSLIDYMESALKMDIIAKAGSWLSFEAADLRVQGWMNLYDAIKTSPDAFAKLRALVDGETLEEQPEAEDA